MPTKPQPLEIYCSQCNWQQVWQPPSDALSATDLPPAVCPRCKCVDLEVRQSSDTSVLWARIRQLFTSF